MKLGWMAAGVVLLTGNPAASAETGHPLAEVAASPDVRGFAAWIESADDNGGRPFILVDKPSARIFVFSGEGRLEGAAPALLGLARGDRSTPGIGTRALSRIAPQERTTPAGRFEAALGLALGGKDILWVDYEAAISLHRVITGDRADRRLERLATADSRDNRISYGCINVPAAFYDGVVKPAFAGEGGVVYVLPDTESLSTIFPAYGRAAARRQADESSRSPGQ